MSQRKRRRFTVAFKQEAVRLCTQHDRSIGQVAQELDLVESAMRRWVKQSAIDRRAAQANGAGARRVGHGAGATRPQRGLVHDSDRGCQYAADAYRRVLRDHGVVCSMSRKGNGWDNAVTESVFATLKTELIHRQPWPTRRGITDAVAAYIEGFYNPYRLHSSLGCVSPSDYERRHARQAQQAA